MRPLPPPVITTVPFAGSDAEAIVFGPPSTSVSLASTSIAVAAAVLGDRRGVIDSDRSVVEHVTVTDTVASSRR